MPDIHLVIDESTETACVADIDYVLENKEDINEDLDELLYEDLFTTPYIAFERVRVLFEEYGIVLGNVFLEGEFGDVVFDLYEDDIDTGMHIFFIYELNDEGFYDIVCSLADDEELEIALDEFGE
jgi:hypothetical protein